MGAPTSNAVRPNATDALFEQPSTQQVAQRDLQLWHHVLVFLIAFVLLVSRRPDALFHAQFWAEDGHAWYADAYNFGWFHAFFRTFGGYFQLQPRFAAAFALLVPLSHAPLVMNVIAIAGYVLPVNILLSSRSGGWGSLRFRALLAASYIALPMSPELRAIITNGQWLLALCAFFLIAGQLPRNTRQRVWDVAVVSLSGLSGPFCFFLLPLAAFIARKGQARWRWVHVGILACCSVVQAWALLFLNPDARRAPLGASPDLFVRILGGNVFLGAIIGPNPFARLRGPIGLLILLAVAIAGIVLTAKLFVRARLEMKLFCLLAAMIFAASLASPLMVTPPGTTCWQILASAQDARYWFLPTMAIIWLLLNAYFFGSGALKSISTALLLLLPVSMVLRWRDPAFPDLHFADEAARFQAAPAGTTVIIPENPDGWTVRLVKHAQGDR